MMNAKLLPKRLCKNGSNAGEVQHMKVEQLRVTLASTSLWVRASGMNPWGCPYVLLVMEYGFLDHIRSFANIISRRRKKSKHWKRITVGEKKNLISPYNICGQFS